MNAETIEPVEVASAEDLNAAIALALSKLDLSRAELEQQAVVGRFTSEAARRAWFLVSSLEQISGA